MIMGNPKSGRVNVTLSALPDGVRGVRQTLAHMVDLAKKGRADYRIRSRAEKIIRNIRQKNYLEEARAIQAWVRDNIRYTRDVRDVETLSSPDQTLARSQGDCDDKSLLVASLLESIGHQTRFVAVGTAPNDFEHVLAEVNIDGQWIAVETTENVPLGWYPDRMPYRLVFNV